MSQQNGISRPHQAPPPPPPPRASNRVRRSDSGSDRLHRRNWSGARHPPQMTDFEFLDVSQVQVDSSSDSDFQPKRPSRPAHSRSMSNPFPSLFSVRKKKHDSGDPNSSDGEGDFSMPGSKGASPKGLLATRKPLKDAPAVADKNFTTGNCMTCGSLMRWPRELDVFKCTICVTINDLKPTTREHKGPGDYFRSSRPHDDEHSASSPTSSNHAQPISLEQTKLLVRQCLHDFLSLPVSQNPAKPSHLPPTVRSPVWGGPMPPRRPSVQDGPGSVSSTAHAPVWDNEDVVPAVGAGPSIARRFNDLAPRSYSTSHSDRRPRLHAVLGPPVVRVGNGCQAAGGEGTVETGAKKIFKPLEDYIASCFTSLRCLNVSFGGHRLAAHSSRQAEDSRRRPPETRRVPPTAPAPVDVSIAELDAKMLLLGDVAENGSWWSGGGGSKEEKFRGKPHQSTAHRGEEGPPSGATKSPCIDWAEVAEWYRTIVNAGEPWKAVYDELLAGGHLGALPDADLPQLESRILAAQEHVQRVLLKATEVLLKRPGRPLTEPSDLRFLLLILANPLLQANCSMFAGHYTAAAREKINRRVQGQSEGEPLRNSSGPASGRHSGIIKRIIGLISNSSNACHNQLVAWFARYPESRLVEIKDIVSGLLAYRLARQNEKKEEASFLSPGQAISHIVPSFSSGEPLATLHAALGQPSGGGGSSNIKIAKMNPPKKLFGNGDWQIKAAARVMTLIFAGNNLRYTRRGHTELSTGSHTSAGDCTQETPDRLKGRVHARGQLLPTSDFYVSLLDGSDLVADFEAWESRRAGFSFCQYPFLLSIWAKIQILEHDAKRQMQKKARDAFFDTLLSNRPFTRYLDLNVRRDCLVEDSLKAVSEAIGSGGEDIKKGLRITFRGEEGVDAGGLRKEWFLLLVREVFNPDHGMFVYDEDSCYCYFNPNSFETSDQYFLVGVVLGLAIYNSTILDVALPPFAFRKLLAAAPPAQGNAPAHARPPTTYSLDDLAEFRPRLARGLRQLLEYDGDDVESVFCLDFAVDVDKYGSVERVALTPGGENRPVTASNRREFVDLYVRYVLDTAVSRQFEPFKRGFFTVCGGNALSLFRAEEIERLVRGSDEALDIASLRAVADYDGWRRRRRSHRDGGGVGRNGCDAAGPNQFGPAAGHDQNEEQGQQEEDDVDEEPTVRWFWESFESASPADQRKLLIFVTGSDRIPAVGATSLAIRLVCHGDDCGRYPTARTCFNTLALYRYASKERLEAMLWGAVHESEGFGLK